MGRSLLIFTTARLTDLDMDRYVTELGGALISCGSVLKGDGVNVWPMVDNSVLDDPDDEDLPAAAAMLGAPVRTCIDVEISSGRGGYRVAGRFVGHLAEQHPCVVRLERCCDSLLPAEQALPILEADDLGPPCLVHGPDWGFGTRSDTTT